MTTIIVKTLSTGEISTQRYQVREDAISAGKWYLGIKANGSKKYQVIISKILS